MITAFLTTIICERIFHWAPLVSIHIQSVHITDFHNLKSTSKFQSTFLSPAWRPSRMVRLKSKKTSLSNLEYYKSNDTHFFSQPNRFRSTFVDIVQFNKTYYRT